MSKEKEFDSLFRDIYNIREDERKIREISRLQEAFRNVSDQFRREYNESVSHSVGYIKTHLKNNNNIRETVNDFITRFVVEENREQATEELYDMLAGELLHTFSTLQHASCILI